MSLACPHGGQFYIDMKCTFSTLTLAPDFAPKLYTPGVSDCISACFKTLTTLTQS